MSPCICLNLLKHNLNITYIKVFSDQSNLPHCITNLQDYFLRVTSTVRTPHSLCQNLSGFHKRLSILNVLCYVIFKYVFKYFLKQIYLWLWKMIWALLPLNNILISL